MSLKQNKLENLILFFANKEKNHSINRLKLIKLLWLADKIHLARYGRTISDDHYCAMTHGPVASNILNLAQNGNDKITGGRIDTISKSEFDPKYFSKSDIKILEYVWSNFGEMDQFELRNYSHTFPEWKRFESMLNNKMFPNSYSIVMPDLFEFPELEKFSDILSPERIESSREIYLAHDSIENFLNN